MCACLCVVCYFCFTDLFSRGINVLCCLWHCTMSSEKIYAATLALLIVFTTFNCIACGSEDKAFSQEQNSVRDVNEVDDKLNSQWVEIAKKEPSLRRPCGFTTRKCRSRRRRRINGKKKVFFLKKSSVMLIWLRTVRKPLCVQCRKLLTVASLELQNEGQQECI